MSRIPFYSLGSQHNETRDELMKAIERVIADNQYILGDRLEEFETAFARQVNTKYCIGVSSGFDAIKLSLQVLGIGQGDEVIVPAHTFIATWMAVSAVGATPVPVEPDLASYNIDANRIEAAINARTRAIIPVHLYGLCCDMKAILAVARKHRLFVVEDNAQAHGALYNESPAGSMGDINATSFYPSKNLGGLGDGGGITTNSSSYNERARLLRNYGSSEKHSYRLVGSNSRLSEIHAAALSVKLRYLSAWNKKRMEIAVMYCDRLRETGDLVLPVLRKDGTHVYHLFVVTTTKRNALRLHLDKAGIETMIHYPIPPHLQESYQTLGYKQSAFPIAEQISASCLSLPLWPGITELEVDFICERIREFY